MRKPRLGGIRLRLALAISITTLVAVVASFVALERGTESDLRDRIDSELAAQHSQFEAAVLEANVRTPAQLRVVSNRYLRAQRYNPASRILIIKVNGYPIVTNQQDVLERELERDEGEETDGRGRGRGRGQGGESGEEEGSGGESEDSFEDESSSGESLPSIPGIEAQAWAAAGDKPTLLETTSGFSTIETAEAGQVRVLTEPIVGVNDRRLGTFRAADPLASIELTREGLRNTFLIVGIAALLLAAAVSISLANVITRPLRQMARFASNVDAGDLGDRLQLPGRADEVTVLADSFDGMLDRLERAFRQQQDFVSDASHELRTPLTVMRGQIDLLRRGIDDPVERDQTIATVLTEIERMNHLVDDMLSLARAEEGSFLRMRPVSVQDFFDDLRRDVPLLGRRNFEVATPPDGILTADPERLEQVFRNLIRNAVKHTGSSSRIQVTVDQAADRLRFSVADDGPGIPKDQLAHVFDRFHRVDHGRARDEGGSGLGLAIARAIVEAHGGRIWAESEPGQGATIRFELPGFEPGDQPRSYS